MHDGVDEIDKQGVVGNGSEKNFGACTQGLHICKLYECKHQKKGRNIGGVIQLVRQIEVSFIYTCRGKGSEQETQKCDEQKIRQELLKTCGICLI